MKPSLLLRHSSIALTALLIGGCDTGGEYNAPKSSQNSPPATSSPCPTAHPLTLTDGAAELGLALQGEFLALVKAGKDEEAFDKAFEEGEELFSTEFTAAQGSGAKVGPDVRFTRMPRADLACAGEWAAHQPGRATGPNAQSCDACHNRPNDGAGSIAVNVHRDPNHTADPKQMIQRNTPHLLGGGALQRLAEEMTTDLFDIRAAAGKDACSKGQVGERQLSTKGVDFGVIRAECYNGQPRFETSGVKGIAADLVVRPFEWKKSVIFIRDFARGAFHNEIGMQGIELVGVGKDGDGDGVANELSIGQVTAMSVYLAAQARPTTKTELIELGLVDPGDPLSPTDVQSVKRGAEVFRQIACDVCHKPQLALVDTVFREPSSRVEFRDDRFFESKQNPVEEGLDWRHPIAFDLSKDQPDNRIEKDGQVVRLGSFTEKDAAGHTIVRLYSDLKRHDMGPELAESIDELGNGKMTVIQYLGGKTGSGSGRSTFGTEELWGVGCSGPWMHDGRATTLREAIEYHGGEGAESRSAFRRLDAGSQKDLFAFLYDQVLFVRESGSSDKPDLSICKPKD